MATTPDSTLARYSFGSVAPAHTEAYLWKPILAACRRLDARRVLDLGCGNGAFCKALLDAGFEVAGCDPSEDGIRLAAQACPGVTFRQMSVDDDPASLGTDFDVVVSTEVVEHLVAPRNLPAFAAKVLRPGGHLIVSTPYHGYWKNLVLSLANRWDGILINDSPGNTVGGTAAGARNVISGNAADGVFISGGSENHVLGNFIGTDISGGIPLANACLNWFSRFISS